MTDWCCWTSPDLPVVIIALQYDRLVVAGFSHNLPVVILALLYDGLVVAGSILRRLTGGHSCTPV